MNINSLEDLFEILKTNEFISVNGLEWSIRDIFPKKSETVLIKKQSFICVLDYIEKNHYGLPLSLMISQYNIRLGMDKCIFVNIRYDENGRHFIHINGIHYEKIPISKIESEAIKTLKLITSI